MRKLILALVTLVGVALLIDFGAAAWSEYRVSRALREGGALTADPAVTIHGFPFLTQARAGHYENVEIRAQGVPSGTLGDITIEANLIGAHADAGELLDGSIRTVPVDLLYGRVMIDATELGQLYGIPDLQVSAPPADKSDGTGGSGGSGRTTAGGVVLPGTAVLGLFTTTLEPQNLPFGVRPTAVEARGSTIVIEGEAHRTTIDLEEVQRL